MKTKTQSFMATMLLLCSAATWAASPDAKGADLVDVQFATCAQFAKAMTYTKPPAKPTEKQAALAVLAQDDLVLAMMWVNGYVAGRDGAKGTHAFDKDWIVTHIGKLSAVCKASPGTLLLRDAVA